jgi:hypothetical protein
VTVADVLHVALVDRSRIGELEPAAGEMNPELLAWLKLG